MHNWTLLNSERREMVENKDMFVCFTGNSLIFDGGKDKAGNIKLVIAPAN